MNTLPKPAPSGFEKLDMVRGVDCSWFCRDGAGQLYAFNGAGLHTPDAAELRAYVRARKELIRFDRSGLNPPDDRDSW